MFEKQMNKAVKTGFASVGIGARHRRREKYCESLPRHADTQKNKQKV